MTNQEIINRIKDVTAIAGYDLKNKTFNVYWKDANPNHATTITDTQFNLITLANRRTLLYYSRKIRGISLVYKKIF